MSSRTRGSDLHAARFSFCGLYRDRDAEADYRAARADSICQRARWTAMVVALAFAAAAPYDYAAFAGRPAFAVLLTLRVGAVAVGLVLYLLAKYRGGRCNECLNAGLLVFEAYITSAFLCVVAIHGGEASFHTMSTLAIVLVLYVFLPNLTRLQFILPPLFSVLFLVGFRLLLGAPVDELFIPALILLLANLLGFQFARTTNRAQRLEYGNLMIQQRLNEQLRSEIAERERAEQRVRESDENFRRLFEAAPVPLVLTDLNDGNVLRANGLAVDLFGVQGVELNDLQARDFYAQPDERDRLASRVTHEGHVSGIDACMRTAGGKNVDVLLAASGLEYHKRAAMLVGLMDISMQKRIARQFKRLANIDPLTAINNRRAFFLVAESELRRAHHDARPCSVMLVDADDFKQINDRFGHAVGDSALRAIADALRDGLRESDVLGRIGGEEFAVLLPGLTVAEAHATAETLRSRVAEVRLQDGELDELRLTVSIGVAGAAASEGGIDTALNRADRAMYAAKHDGRNRVGIA